MRPRRTCRPTIWVTPVETAEAAAIVTVATVRGTAIDVLQGQGVLARCEAADLATTAKNIFTSCPVGLRLGRKAQTQALWLERVRAEGARGGALTDTLAAMSYGAPAGAHGYPPKFYVPDEATRRQAVQLLGPARTTSSRAATVRVAPVPMVCEQRVDPLILASSRQKDAITVRSVTTA